MESCVHQTNYFTPNLPKLKHFLVLRVDECKYCVSKLVPFLLDHALEEGLSAYQALAPVPQRKVKSVRPQYREQVPHARTELKCSSKTQNPSSSSYVRSCIHLNAVDDV